MEWSRIKTIILLILAGTNLCLFAFLAQRNLQERSEGRQSRQNTILFLRQQGVEVSDEVVPEEMELFAQTVERNRAQEQAMATGLLGETAEERPRGGEVYRYENERGYLQFHSDGTFQGEFTPGAIPVEHPDSGSGAREIMEKLGFDGEILSIQTAAGEKDVYTVILRQHWSGVPILNQQVTLTEQDGYLISMTDGHRLVGTPQINPNCIPISVPTALIRFYNGLNGIGDVCSRIERITQGYISTVSSSGGLMELIPTWYVTTNTGSYFLNTLTGQVSRAEGWENQIV